MTCTIKGSEMNTGSVSVYKHKNHPVIIEQTKAQREWMDETLDHHAYKCFPVSLVNTIGWSISFEEDIEFIWDGISDTTPDHIKIIRGPQNVCNLGRGNATVSFYTGLTFKTDEDISILSIVPPNYFIDGATPFTSIISTSFYDQAYPVAWKVTRPNHNIIIPARTPVATLIPVSMNGFAQTELNIYDKVFDPNGAFHSAETLAEWKRLSDMGKFTNFYRDAKDYKGDSVGKHELKSLSMKINDLTGNR